MLPRIYTYRNLWAICLIMLLGVFSACTDTVDDDLPSGDHYLTLSRVVIPAQNKGESVTINSIRVLVFSKSGSLVSNVYYDQEKDLTGTFDSTLDAYILSIGGEKEISAHAGTNHVYVILNEATGGLTSSLTAEGLDKTKMDEIRSGKIPYTELIPVTDNEPGFVMCVYDKVDVTEHIQNLNMTGFAADSPVYGYGMRRTMAKVVLESVIGGVTPEGYIVGTNETVKWNGNVETDQIDNDIVSINQTGKMEGGNTALAATSEVFVTKVELLNVPNEYSWTQDENNSQDQTVYTGNYLNPQNISAGFTPDANYFRRTWPGNITANGTVDFTRTDAMPSIWRQDGSNGINSYGVNEAYPFTVKENELNYGPQGPYLINSGNFVPWVKDVYGNGEYVKGEIVPVNLQLTASLDPAVWSINGDVAYYIPENIQHTALSDNSNHTKLRIYFCIGTIMAKISDDEIKAIIDAALEQDKVPIVGEDGETLIINDNDNWQAAGITYVREQGKYIANTSTLGDGKLSNGQTIEVSKDKEWGICYEGLKTIWKGTGVKITNREGKYYVDSTDETRNLYIDVPLNNDTHENKDGESEEEDAWKEDVSTDHNIYRGHEYRVKLYVTKSSDEWRRSANPASRTINIGGEELTITGKVTASPIK